MAYDYLIVGAGLAGTAFARIMTDHGFRCLVLERLLQERCFPGLFQKKMFWRYIQWERPVKFGVFRFMERIRTDAMRDSVWQLICPDLRRGNCSGDAFLRRLTA